MDISAHSIPMSRSLNGGFAPSGLVVSNSSGGFIDVQKTIIYQRRKRVAIASGSPPRHQFSNNFGTIHRNKPFSTIFMGGRQRLIRAKAKLNIKTLEFRWVRPDNQTLEAGYLLAYNAAVVALKMNSSQTSVDAATKAMTCHEKV